MRAVLQRVKQASVSVAGETVGRIDAGLLVLVAVHQTDGDSDVDWMVQKLPNLRLFPDGAGKMNLSLLDCAGQLLLVSQFTLYGDVQKGRRPSFTASMEPVRAQALIERLVEKLRETGITVETGRFGADMDVSLLNHGPVTIIIESRSAMSSLPSLS